jgi:cytochrome c peroxidase
MFSNFLFYLNRFQPKLCLSQVGFSLMAGLIVSPEVYADPYLGLPPLILPADNPQTPETIALGKRLFNDKRFSADGSMVSSVHVMPQPFLTLPFMTRFF